jgi:uracil permease
VPVFLGSSFAFIGGIQIVMQNDPARIPLVQGGIICAGAVYMLLSVIVYFVGVDRVRSFFPPIVTGPVIVVIGLTLSPTAISMASSNWGIALITLLVVIVSNLCQGFFKLSRS